MDNLLVRDEDDCIQDDEDFQALRRSRSVRASIRLLGSRFKSQKENQSTERTDHDRKVELFKAGSKSEHTLVCQPVSGRFRSQSPPPITPKRKHISSKQAKKKDGVDLILKPIRHANGAKDEKCSKFSGIFSSKSRSKTFVTDIPLDLPNSIPPKAAEILQIPINNNNHKKGRHRSNDKCTRNRINPDKSTVNIKRIRRSSEGDSSLQLRDPGGGTVNPAFVFTTPPKEKQPNQQPLYHKLPYGALLEGCAGELPSLNACAPHAQPHHYENKMAKKRQTKCDTTLDKIPNVNIHLHALFAAVECGNIEYVQNILDCATVDINSYNADGFTPLDVAMLTQNRPLAKLLMVHGAQDGIKYPTPQAIGLHLSKLIKHAENQIQLIMNTAIGNCSSNVQQSSSEPGPAGTSKGPTDEYIFFSDREREKQLAHWDKRVAALSRMSQGLQQTSVPDVPLTPFLEVCGSTSVTIRLHGHPRPDGPLVTKFKLQWSARSDFSNICGSRDVSAGPLMTRVIASGLTRGRRYYFRAAAGNIKGYSGFMHSFPPSVVPSSWRDNINDEDLRFAPHVASVEMERIDRILTGIARRPVNTTAKSKGVLKQLFTNSYKFQRNLKRGVYLACVFYFDGKVLFTNEEFLPCVEVDVSSPPSIYADLLWFMKVSHDWGDVQHMRSDMQQMSLPSQYFRLRLLTAACLLQQLLNMVELGRVYFEPLLDYNGIVVVSIVRSIRTVKNLSLLYTKWSSIDKLNQKLDVKPNKAASALIANNIRTQVKFDESVRMPLASGLYVGYLKLKASLENVSVIVPIDTPNIIPHIKVRENNHVSADEWEYFKFFKYSHKEELTPDDIVAAGSSFAYFCKSRLPTDSQKRFIQDVANAALKLIKNMGETEECALKHRFYDYEVLEISPAVSFIIVCPPPQQACVVPGAREVLLDRGDLQGIPVQAFEIAHLATFNSFLLGKYAKLSCFLEVEVAMTRLAKRKAFSNEEAIACRAELEKYERLDVELTQSWKISRWLTDLCVYARDKNRKQDSSGIFLQNMIDKMMKPRQKGNEFIRTVKAPKLDLLQIPPADVKPAKTPGRGSWPGPSNVNAALHADISRSDQHLNTAPTDNALNNESQTTNSDVARKYSVDAQQSSRFSDQEPIFDYQNDLNSNQSQQLLVPVPSTSTSTSPQLIVKGCTSSKMTTTKTCSTTNSLHSVSSDSESRKSLTKNSHKVKSIIPSPPCTIEDPEPCSSKSDNCIKPTLDMNLRDDDEATTSKSGAECEEGRKAEMDQKPGVLQVFAAYDTGLASGTSLKLHVTPRTTAREVIDLVVKQLYMAAVLKGKVGPYYGPDRLNDFVLVAVIGARERCLRDDFRPLQLQNPWRKGKLFVRLKHDVLAALQQSAKQPAFI